MKRTAIILILSSLVISFAQCGDYFPYRAKKLTYEFTTPFDSESSPKLSEAKITIVTKPDDTGRLGWNSSIKLKSIDIKLGDQTITIPEKLLDDMGEVSLNTIDFYWVGGRHHFAIATESDLKMSLVIRDGVLVDYIKVNSRRGSFPEIFKGTSPWPE